MAETASALLTEAFNALNVLHKEGVTFRTLSIEIPLTRTRAATVFNGMEATLDSGSVALFPFALGITPRDGEVITDAKDYAHTIRKVQRLGDCFRCECDITEP
jgi:hypothetical protein